MSKIWPKWGEILSHYNKTLDAVLVRARTLHFSEQDILNMPYVRVHRYFRRYAKMMKEPKK